MRSLSEEQFRTWSEGLRRSDQAAYAAVFDATYDALFRYACFITHEREAAYDILQDVFMKLWQVRDTIDPTRSLRALLYQMVRNYALNHERQKKRRAASALDDLPGETAATESLEADYHAEALGQHLSVCIAEMPERRREAFMLSRYEGLSHDEIARLMNLAPKTVNNHIVLALQHLRARLHAYQNESMEL